MVQSAVWIIVSIGELRLRKFFSLVLNIIYILKINHKLKSKAWS